MHNNTHLIHNQGFFFLITNQTWKNWRMFHTSCLWNFLQVSWAKIFFPVTFLDWYSNQKSIRLFWEHFPWQKIGKRHAVPKSSLNQMPLIDRLVNYAWYIRVGNNLAEAFCTFDTTFNSSCICALMCAPFKCIWYLYSWSVRLLSCLTHRSGNVFSLMKGHTRNTN